MTLAPSGAAPVLFEERDGVLIITINRPELCNAANAAVAYAVAGGVDDFERRPDLRVAIRTTGGRAA